MIVPHFLLADNSDNPEEFYIVHTQYPRFVWNVNHDELEWMDEIQGEEDELVTEIANLLDCASSFYEREISRHAADAEMAEPVLA